MKGGVTVVAVLFALAVVSQGRAINPAGAPAALEKADKKVLVVKPKVAAAAASKATPLPVALKANAAVSPKKEKVAAKEAVKGKVVQAVVSKAKAAAVPATPKTSLRAPTKNELVKAKVVEAKVAAPVKVTKKAALVAISPPLHDGDALGDGHPQSDKKFFGPPFPADYPEDKRPVPDKSIMDKLKSSDQPYPALQSKADYDRDYVKDENSDSGHWKAQFEYDTLRNRMAKERADANRAAGKAGKEGQDALDAQGRADKAAKDVADAQKEADDALRGEKDAKTAEDFEDVAPSAEKLEEIKKAVAAAEANLAKEEKEFEECKKQLELAEKNLKELKAVQVDMEKKLAADTKLWIESKNVRLNLKKTNEEAFHSKRLSADARLKVAQAAKSEVDATLAAKKAKSDLAQKRLEKEQADVVKAKQDLERATVTLQKLRGYKPADVKPARSGAASFAAALIPLVIVAMNAF